MNNTPGVKAAVDENRIVVACAYRGYVADEVIAALPKDFPHVKYVAKFMDGALVAVEPGLPEEAMQKLLGAQVTESKSCEDKSCDKPTEPAPARP